MTNAQINQAIAEACGIVSKDQYGPLYQTPEGWVVDCPQFCTDLNAMHDAESMLQRNGTEFSQILLELVSDAAGPGVQYAYGSFKHVHASAKLRAEAFLRTLGKWEEALE